MIDALLPLMEFSLKIFLYFTVLKLRSLEARFLTCSLAAGASLVSGLLPLPVELHFVLTLIVAGYFIIQNTGATLLPDGIGIPAAVEITGAFTMRFVVLPAVELI